MLRLVSLQPSYFTIWSARYANEACSTGPAVDLEGASRPESGDGLLSGSEFDMVALEHGTVYRVSLPLIVKQPTP